MKNSLLCLLLAAITVTAQPTYTQYTRTNLYPFTTDTTEYSLLIKTAITMATLTTNWMPITPVSAEQIVLTNLFPFTSDRDEFALLRKITAGVALLYDNIGSLGTGAVSTGMQPASANLTNWSAIAVTTKQPANVALTNLASNPNMYQASNANLTAWQLYTTNQFVGTNDSRLTDARVGLTGMQTNQFTTNVVGTAIVGDVTFPNMYVTNFNLQITNAFLAAGASGGVTGTLNGITWTNVSATNIVGLLTNNTSGIATGATNAVNATNLYNAYLLVPTNSPAAGKRMLATGASSAKWIPATTYLTNAATTAVDFNVPYSELITNAAFAFLAPSNVGTIEYQTCVIMVTNSTGSAVAITAPANVHTTGTMNVTNLSICSFFNCAGRWTNMICLPVW
jgi:hypothetical protein